MRWTAKARVHRLTSSLPRGHQINFLFQRHLTHTYPRSDARLAAVVAHATTHAALLEGAGLELRSSTLFEFGAGWDLAVPLMLASLGAKAQIVVDLNALHRPELVVDIAGRLDDRGLPHQGASADELLSTRGIDYRAPCDARDTGLAAGSVDAVTSTDTMEHIPDADLDEILAECHRILRREGLASFLIDYSDHYAHADRSIGPYNFLRYTDEEWRRYNPGLHYQNRLRHSDHVDKIERAGFEVLEVRPVLPSPEQRRNLDQLPLAQPFRNRDPEDLAVLGATILARRR